MSKRFLVFCLIYVLYWQVQFLFFQDCKFCMSYLYFLALQFFTWFPIWVHSLCYLFLVSKYTWKVPFLYFFHFWCRWCVHNISFWIVLLWIQCTLWIRSGKWLLLYILRSLVSICHLVGRNFCRCSYMC